MTEFPGWESVLSLEHERWEKERKLWDDLFKDDPDYITWSEYLDRKDQEYRE